MALRHTVPQSVHGRHAVADGRRLHLLAAQPLLEDAAVYRTVIDNQHGQPVGEIATRTRVPQGGRAHGGSEP